MREKLWSFSRESKSSLPPLEGALKLVSEKWIPINPEVRSVICTRLKQNRYNSSGELIRDLKQDCGLYLHTVRKVLETTPENERSSTHPTTLLSKSSLPVLEKIIINDGQPISHHILRQSSKSQIGRLQQMVVSGVVTETLASEHGVDAELSFSCALMRQLGLALISWNYPHIYDRATAKSGEPGSLDKHLSMILGFSPTMLAVSLLRRWGVSTEMRAVVGDTSAKGSAESGASSSDLISSTIHKLCLVGEAFARATVTDGTPTKSGDWNYAKDEITKTLGESGIKLLIDKSSAALDRYANVSEEFRRSSESIAATLKSTPKTNESLPDLSKLPHEVRDEIARAYTQIDGSRITKDTIDLLRHKLFPVAGFEHGCIFLLEPDTLRLIPRLPIGEDSTMDYESVDVSGTPGPYSPVLTAFRGSKTHTDNSVDPETGATVAAIAGVLGSPIKMGVLYVERSSTNAQLKNDELAMFETLLKITEKFLGFVES